MIIILVINFSRKSIYFVHVVVRIMKELAEKKVIIKDYKDAKYEIV